MTKIKLSALACAILVGGQQLVAEDVNDIINLEHYIYQPVNINNETKIITGNPWAASTSINVDNNGKIISRDLLSFQQIDINIKNNSNAIFENEVDLTFPYFHIINNSTAVFNKKLKIIDFGDDGWPIIEKDNGFSGGSLSLDNSTLDIKEAEFYETNALINHGSTAKIDNLYGYESKIYVVNDSKLEINKNAIFEGAHLAIKDNSNTTINGELAVLGSGTIKFVDGELAVNDDGDINIAHSNLNVGGEVNFASSVAKLNNSSNVNFKDSLVLLDSAMLLKNSSSLNVGGVADFTDSALVVQNGSKVLFNDKFAMKNGVNPVFEQDNNFSGGSLSLDNSTLDIKKEAEFHDTNVLINHGSTAKIDNLVDYDSEIYVVNDSKLEIDKNAEFEDTYLIVKDSKLEIDKNAIFYDGTDLIVENNSNLNVAGEVNFKNSDTELNNSSNANFKDKLTIISSDMLLKNSSTLNVGGVADFADSALIIIKDNSNATINGALTVYDSGTIEFVDGEFVVNDGGIKIDKSNLNVAGEANFLSSDTELDSSNANFQNKLTLIDSAMLLKNSSSLNVGGVANFTDSALVVQNGSKVMFNDKLTMKNGAEKSIIILDNGSEINIKGDFENHGVIYYGASADSASKITVDGKATLKDTTEIGIYATSGLNQAVFLESKEAIENQVTDENIYAMYFDPDNEDANEEGLVKYDENIIDAVLNLSKDGKKLLVQILMSGDMQNKPINEKIDFIAESTQAAGVNLTAQDLDIITSLFTIGDAKGNGAVATEGIKLAEQAKQGNQEAAQIISKTAQSIQKNSQDSITATSNLINTFNLATKNEVGKRIINVTTRSNVSQLANFIESLDGQKFADASNGVLLSMMADEMAAYQNSFYLNALGAKGDFKDGTNPKIYGAILGYDRMIDDLLIGGYFSYTNSETENIELDSNIYELGLYSRYFLDNNEFDFNIAGGYGKNDLSYTQNIFGINKILQSNFNSSYIALGLDYGYRFAINDNANIKPYIGADYLYSKTQNYTLKDQTGKDFQKVQSNTVKNLKANLGLEMVKNFDEISIYADAKIKRDLINDEGFTRSSFAGSSAGFNIQGNDKKHTNFAIDTGIVYNATKNLSINLNLGADVNSDDKIYSTSFGAAYKF